MGESTLIIDCGAAATTATIVTANGKATPVLFSGQRWLPSAVQAAGHKPVPLSPQQLETHDDTVVDQPLRHLLDETVTVAGRQYDPADLVAATLSHVHAEAVKQSGGEPGTVVLLVAARTGPRWRTGLRKAASRAGIGSVQLVEAAPAVAAGLPEYGQPSADRPIAVVDLGVTATEVAIVHHAGHGFEVLAVNDDPAVCAGTVDRRLAHHLSGTSDELSEHDSAIWLRLARHARHSLTHAPAVTLPSVDGNPPVNVDQIMLAELADPMWTDIADLIRQTARSCDHTVDALGGVYLVGGGAGIPGGADQLRRNLGIPVVAVDDPAQTTALGAATITQTASRPERAGRPDRPPLRWGRIAARDALAFLLMLVASLALITQAVAVTDIYDDSLREAPLLITTWSAYGLAALIAVLACAAAGQLLATGLAEQPDTTSATTLRARLVTGAAIAGVALAVIYAAFAKLLLGVHTDPFLPIALKSAIPAAILIAASVQLRRWHPATTAPLLPPTASVLCAAAGLILVSAGHHGGNLLGTPLGAILWQWRIPSAVLVLAGGALLGAAFGLLIPARGIRLFATAIAAVLGMALISLNTRDTIGNLYTAAVIIWLAVHTTRPAIPLASAFLNRLTGNPRTSDAPPDRTDGSTT